MLGIVFGIACLWGLWRVVRYGRIGFGRRRRWGGRRHRFWLRRLLSRLDATPGQEKVIRDAVDETVSAAHELRGEVFASREEMAKALRMELFDETVMAELLTRHDDALDRLRQTAVGSFAKIHEVLDGDQRERLASWLSRRPRWAGPYRTPA